MRHSWPRRNASRASLRGEICDWSPTSSPLHQRRWALSVGCVTIVAASAVADRSTGVMMVLGCRAHRMPELAVRARRREGRTPAIKSSHTSGSTRADGIYARYDVRCRPREVDYQARAAAHGKTHLILFLTIRLARMHHGSGSLSPSCSARRAAVGSLACAHTRALAPRGAGRHHTTRKRIDVMGRKAHAMAHSTAPYALWRAPCISSTAVAPTASKEDLARVQ